ncbi:MAG: OmpA family protein, partial [Bacteroidota bacterium]
FLNLLSDNDRIKVEQFVLNKARRARDHEINAERYNSLDSKDKKGVDNIAVQFITEKKSLDQLTLTVDNNLFLQRLDDDKRQDIVESIRDKMLLLADDDRFKLTDDDKVFYNNLSDNHLESIKHIAHSFLLSDAEHLSQFLAKEDLEYYNVLGGSQKATVDRIIAKIIRNTYLSDILYTETSSISKSDIQDLQDDISGANSLSEMLASVSPNAVATSLSSRDKNRLVRFLSSGGAKEYLKRTDNVFTMNEDVVTAEYTKLKEKNGQETNSRVFPINFGQQTAGITTNQGTATASNSGSSSSVAKKTYTNGLEVSSLPSEKITQLDRQAIDFYEALSDQDQLKIDRFIGARYINRYYADSDILNADVAFESDLVRSEKSHIKLLSKSLKEDVMSNPEKEAVKQSFVFYDNKATNAKPKWNRLILSYGLEINRNGSYLAKRKDYAFYESLSEVEKGYIRQIEGFRNTNHRILTDNLREDATDVIVPNLVRNIPKYIVKTDKMSIEGELIDNQDGKAVEKFSVALENKSGKKVYQTNTNQKGKFAFKSIETDDYKLVSADERYSEKFEKDYFIKDLTINEVATDEFKNLINTMVFFDFDSKKLRSEAVVTLDEIANAYKKSKFLIELDSHTDNEGDKAYNESLSLDRGSAAKDYLVAKGVENGDIVLKFFGSDKPIAPNDNVYGRQFNRRV